MRDITTDSTPADFTLRYAHGGDHEAIVRLAQLDSQREPTGALLVAESGAGIVAALPLEDGHPIANPFVRTAELVELLRLRTAQLSAEPNGQRRGLRERATRCCVRRRPPDVARALQSRALRKDDFGSSRDCRVDDTRAGMRWDGVRFDRPQ